VTPRGSHRPGHAAGPEATIAEHRAGAITLAVSDAGGRGRPVVFQHGLCGDAAQAAEVFPDDPRLRRITLECRGHGASPAGEPSELSIATFAGDLASLLDAHGLAPAAVGGISMGAAIALRLAVRRPDLVPALVLARPAWITGPAPANMEPNALVGRLLAEHPPERARAAFERSGTAFALAREAPDNLASLRGFFGRLPRETTVALLTTISADGPGVDEAEVGRLAVPTLVIGHRRDHVHPLAHAAALARLIPGARLVEITPKAEDRGRYVADFRSALHAFLAEFVS